MIPASENRRAVTDTVASLTAQAAELETRATELRKALAVLDDNMRAASNALQLILRSAGASDAPRPTPSPASGGQVPRVS
ncbi:hypothetical protein SSP24_83250 [Streptomyces spinoverrucosus]|uniref:Uncharacterized protein n=1 Tax=Streptomyces spinoverrucosus TaxID=284043 RepID=A0A4Y3VYD6_9ACTN|nr:hypothetical protein SSP24_83250 [Streptomyces spinoverrucosus]GHB99404.1 hypothetical protein GCM10010397_84540 [Streptomyces spinoverrucosus]